MKKLAALGVAVLAALSLGSMCDKDEEKKPSHPGCPGESSRSVDDAVSCTCGPKEVLQAGSLQCKDCDPTGSAGVYCDCGKNKLFSMNGSLDQQLGISSPQVQCVPEPNPDAPCADGEYPFGEQCKKCEPKDCGACGVCGVGETCISGKCVSAFACRVREIYPYCEQVPETDEYGRIYVDEHNQPITTTQCIKESACDYSKNAQCAYVITSAVNAIAGDGCSCSPDAQGCEYDGVTEPLSQ